MKILCPAVLDGYSRRKDRSVSIRLITQEKTSQEIMRIDEMVDQYGILYFRGQEKMNESEVKELDRIELDVYDNPKTQSQRLRAVLFLNWKQEGAEGNFKKYYKQKTEQVIQHFKSKLLEV
jgi:hypothetical protein